jgi:hypothetical protein
MAIDFQRKRADFLQHTGTAQNLNLTFVFPTDVRRAESAVNGFGLRFPLGDHHFHRAEVDTRVLDITGKVVTVRVDFALRDNSGVFDDIYDGYVDVLVIVDRVSGLLVSLFTRKVRTTSS